MSKTETQIDRVNRERAVHCMHEIRDAIKELQDTLTALHHAVNIGCGKVAVQDMADLAAIHSKARSILFIIRANNIIQY